MVATSTQPGLQVVSRQSYQQRSRMGTNLIVDNPELAKVQISKEENSRPEVVCEKSVFKDFVKFTRKQLCRTLFYNKTAVLRPASLLK